MAWDLQVSTWTTARHAYERGGAFPCKSQALGVAVLAAGLIMASRSFLEGWLAHLLTPSHPASLTYSLTEALLRFIQMH